MQGVANRTPILRNAAFASVPSRNPQSRSLAQSTFRGGFSQSGFEGQRIYPMLEFEPIKPGECA